MGYIIIVWITGTDKNDSFFDSSKILFRLIGIDLKKAHVFIATA